MPSYILRNYQEKAAQKAVWAYENKLEGNDLIVVATGGGKSLIVAEIANRLDQNILILQPTREILVQNLSKLRQYVPEYEIGVFSASMNQKSVNKYTLATIQSIYKRPYLFDQFKVVLLDEAHLHNVKNTDSMYTSFFKAIGNPKVFGLSATPYRNMTGYHKDIHGQLYATTTLKLINRIKPDFWKRILVNVGIGDLIAQGYLCPLAYEDRTIIEHKNLKLNKSHTEFDLDDYGNKIIDKRETILETIFEAQGRFKFVLVFCPSVAAAEAYAEQVPFSACVSAKTPDDERDRIVRDFKSGRIQTVFNVGVFSIGFDHPELDCIILLRPTRSLALYMQILGRGVRIAPGKTHCTVIDYSGTYKQLGPIETVELRKERFPEFKQPMWDIFSQTAEGEKRWHNTALYSFAIKEQSKSYWAAKKQGLWR